MCTIILHNHNHHHLLPIAVINSHRCVISVLSSLSIMMLVKARVATSPSSIIMVVADIIGCSGASTHTITHRSKHSATQVNRLFKQNPARLRLLKKEEGISASEKKQLAMQQIPEPTFPSIHKPTFLDNGWSAPPHPEVEIPDYPFKVERTGRKPFGAVGFLPVYRDVR